MFKPRPKQKEVLDYLGGTMGVAAVPGSGKTHTLSALAAKLVAEGGLAEDQEVLIVTLVNSAVDNFKERTRSFIESMGLLPGVGYRVRTLHGLAHDILRERPSLVGLSDDFQIMDERESNRIRTQVVQAWLKAHPRAVIDEYMREDLLENEGKAKWIRREQWPQHAQELGSVFITQAKDLRMDPEILQGFLSRIPLPLPLVEMGTEIYHHYQQALMYRGAIDFSDLIRLAIQALEMDQTFLQRLQARWPYILEDEAQDSSLLQEQILRLLSGAKGNWVRVGDPNQAIFETFTTASPDHLRNFLAKAEHPCDLPNSGRSTPTILALANGLIRWTREQHPVPEVRESLSLPFIIPTPPGDPQPNPPDDATQITFVRDSFSERQEIHWVAEDLKRWLAKNTDRTVAVLTPTNNMGINLVNILRKNGIEYTELLKSTSETRLATGALIHVLKWLADPNDAHRLSTAYKVWRREDRENEKSLARMEAVANTLHGCIKTENFLWPRLDRDWLEGPDSAVTEATDLDQLLTFRELAKRWQLARALPIEQLILTLSMDLFRDPADLALIYKLASLLGQMKKDHPDWGLKQLADELGIIAKNERKFVGFSESDRGFDPEHHQGKVVLATIHKAKGLEWDRVYLMGVNDFWFPSAQKDDSFRDEKWFIRNNLNLRAEMLAQFEEIGALDDEHRWYQEGRATEQARYEYAAERLRLLYVGITRAKEELVITYNNGNGNKNSKPATALQALWRLQEGIDNASS